MMDVQEICHGTITLQVVKTKTAFFNQQGQNKLQWNYYLVITRIISLFKCLNDSIFAILVIHIS
jgi:hypothetical protein